MSEPTTTSPDTARQRQRMPQERATTTARIVLEAAIDHIEHGGEQSVRISDISRSTGVSYGSVYHHFGDRNGLIRAAQLERLRRQPGVDIDAFRHALSPEQELGDFLHGLAAICRNIASPDRADVRLLRASLVAAAKHDDVLDNEIVSMESQVMNDLIDVIDRAKELGIADPLLDSRALAAYLSAVSFGLVLLEANDEQPDTNALAEVIFRGFTAFMPSSEQ